MARVTIPNMKKLVARQQTLDMGGVNQRAHDRLHGPTTLVYQTATTLTTDIGPKLKLPRGGQITGVQARVQGAPTSKMEIDLVVRGVSVFNSGAYLTIQNGETNARFKIVDKPYFPEDSTFQVDIITIAAATGPLIVTIEYLPEY